MDRYVCDLLLTMADDETTPIHGGVVDVEDGAVVWSGPSSEAPDRTEAARHHIDGVLMPGMIDVHCHTPMVLLRGAGEGLPVDRWLHEVMWPREAQLTPDDVRIGMQVGGAELLGNGITTSVEMYFHGDAVAQGATDVGLRCVVTAPVIEEDQLKRFGTWEEQLDEMVATRDRWRNNDLIGVGLGPHAAYSVSDACLRRIAEIALDQDMLVHIHLAEEEWEDAAVRERAGLSAPEYLESIGLFDADVLAAHGVWISETDIAILARNDIAVAHCPCSNTKHASGMAPVDELLNAGVRVGIATDGPASHHRLDLFEEMRMAIRLSRLHYRDAQHFPTTKALRMVTAEAADTIGRPDLGRLTAGCRADMVALSLSGSAFQPVVEAEDDPIARIVWSGSPAAVAGVWVDGRQVVAGGQVSTIDIIDATEQMTKTARRLAR
jgi:5-methylthioadenosine/S-adenosylhomocysteine deaminase